MTLTDRRIAEWLFLVTFTAYGWFYAGGGWNQNSQFDLTRAIVERHTFAIDAYASNTGDVSRHGGHVYSNKSPALSWVAAIPYALLFAMEGDLAATPAGLTLNGYICTLICVALPGALIPALLFAYARRRGIDARWAAAVALGTALATPLFPYATLLMLHVPSAMLLLFALTGRRDAAAGFAAGAATAMNYLCLPAILAFAPRRGRAGAGWFFAGAALPLIALAIYQRICFGGFLANSIAREDARFLSHRALFGIIKLPSAEAAWGITFSPYRGFFFFSPLLLLAFAGAWVWFRRGERRGELAAVAFVALVFFAFNVTFNGWEAGFGVGARYLVPLIPLFGLVLLELRGRFRVAFIALAALSFAINFAAAAVDPQPSATIPRPLTQYIAPLLIRGHFSPDVPITPPWSAATFTGHTSVNRMGGDEALVFQRHAPGSRESEWSSFNLGELLFGPGELASIAPLLLLLILGAIVIARMVRSDTASPT
jgi:MFS family permease